MARRIFFALPVSDALKAEVAEWRSGYAQLPVRWLKDKNLHITLVPPLYTDEPELERIVSRFQEFKQGSNAGDGPIDTLFGRVSFGPDPKNPRLIWAQGEKNEQIAALAHELSHMFSHEEKQQFRLHLTLARFREEQFETVEKCLKNCHSEPIGEESRSFLLLFPRSFASLEDDKKCFSTVSI